MIPGTSFNAKQPAFAMATMIERRTAQRHRVFKHGTLAFRDGGSIDCTVRNVSSNGARVDIAGPVGLPSSFTLLIETDRFMRRCHPVWRSDTRIGLAFD
jgi:hypothetical protein